MKRRIALIASVLVLMLITVVIGGCDDTAHVHTYSNTWSSDDTYHWCAASCEHTDETLGKNEHVWSAASVTDVADCTQGGVKTYACLVCSKTKTETVAASGHTLTAVQAVTANCVSAGNSAYYVCSVCDKWFTDDGAAEEITDKTDVIVPIDASVHASADTKYFSNDDGTHDEKRDCCGAVVADGLTCEFGSDDVCDVCEYDRSHVHSGSVTYVEVGTDSHKQVYSGCGHDVGIAQKCSAQFTDCTAARECECGRTLSAISATHNLVYGSGAVTNADTHHPVKCNNGACEYTGEAKHAYNVGEFTCAVEGCDHYDLAAAKTASYAEISKAVKEVYDSLSAEGKYMLDDTCMAAYDAIDAVASEAGAQALLGAAVKTVTDKIEVLTGTFTVRFINRESGAVLLTQEVKMGTRVSEIDVSSIMTFAPASTQTEVKEYRLKADSYDGATVIAADTDVAVSYEKVPYVTLSKGYTYTDGAWYNTVTTQNVGYITTADGVVAGAGTSFSLSMNVKANAANTTDTDPGFGVAFYNGSTKVIDILAMEGKVRFIDSRGWTADSSGKTGVVNKSDITPGAFTKAKSASGYTFSLVRYGNEMTLSGNGTQLLKINSTEGVVGWDEAGNTGITDNLKSIFTSELQLGVYFTFQAGSSKTLDVKISQLRYAEAPLLAETRKVSTNITAPAAIVSEVNSAEDMADIMTNSPAVAILTVNASGNVVDASNGTICSFREALNKLDNKVIPALKFASGSTTAAVESAIKNNGLSDVMYVSDTAANVKSVRAANPYIRGVLDLSQKDLSAMKLWEIRAEVMKAGAGIVVLPASMANVHDTTDLNVMGVTVWYKATENTKKEMYTLITSGANGIITADRRLMEDALGSLAFSANSVIRPVSIVGHRGTPSLAPELTIAGSSLAATKGANIIENDLYITTDGVVVVSHDNSVATITNGTGKVEENTYEWYKNLIVDDQPDLSDLPADAITQNLPTASLEDYFKCFKGTDTFMFLEIKSTKYDAIAQAIKTLIDKYDIAGQCSVISFNEGALTASQKYIPEIAATLLSSYSDNVSQITRSLASANSAFSVNGFYTIKKDVIDDLAVRGILTWPWTINAQAQVDDYILLGVGGLTTDSSFFAENYVRSLAVDKTEYTLTVGGQTAVTVLAEKYGAAAGDTTFANKVTAVTNAEMIVVDGNDTVTYRNGSLSATAAGEALVMFKYAYLLNSGQTVYVYSTPVEVVVQ